MPTHDTLDPATRHRLTVEDYLLLDREGAFGDRQTELFDGEVYYMSLRHRPHVRVLGDVYFSVRQALRDCGSTLTALIDVNENRVLCHANPRSMADGGGYDGQLDVPFGEALYSATIAGLTVETAGWA